jgi:cytochrome c oxidase subunit 3
MPSPVKPSEWDSFFGGLFARRRDVEAPAGTGVLGMRLFILSLSILFTASLVGYLIVRFRSPQWQPEDAADLPGGLWISTFVLLVSSLTMHGALQGIRRGREDHLRRGLLATLVLGIVFLLLQLVAWLQLVQLGVGARSSLYAFTFYMFTALHGLHVVGGLIPLAVVTRRARQGLYEPSHHAGVHYVSMYWHFLDVVWVVLFTVMVLLG